MRSNHSPALRLFLVLALLPIALTASCSVLGLDDYEDEQERLDAARAVWATEGTENYAYVLQRLCFCGGGTVPARVVVQAGERISVTVVETGEPVPPEFEQYYLTVEELFDFIQDAIEREADDISIEYDPDLGLPLEITIDYVEDAVDEEMAFRIYGYEPAN